MKSERSRAASAASSPSRSLWPVSMVCLPFGSSPGGRGASRRMLMESWMVFEVGSHALAQEHRVMALEDPFAGPVAERPRGLVGLELIERGVVRQVEQDDVVEVPAVRDVVPADEADPELVLVVLHLAREDRAHEELEERVAAAANGEVGREHGHGLGILPDLRGDGAYCRTGPWPQRERASSGDGDDQADGGSSRSSSPWRPGAPSASSAEPPGLAVSS